MGIPRWGWLIAGVLVGGFLLYRIALKSMITGDDLLTRQQIGFRMSDPPPTSPALRD